MRRLGRRGLRRAAGPAFLAALLLIGLPLPRLASAQEVVFRSSFFSDVPAAQGPYFDVAGTAAIIRGGGGPGGPAYPSAPVTRAEFAVVVMRLLSLDPLFVRPDEGAMIFADTDAIPLWARDDVAACVALGIITGFPTGAGGFDFRPAETVGGAEAAAMLLRSLGNAEQITAGWPLGYLYRAFETGLCSGDVAPGDWRFIQPLTPLSRAQTAYLIHNALFCSRDYRPSASVGDGSYGRPPIGGSLAGHSLIVDVDSAGRTLTTSDGRAMSLSSSVVAPGIRGAADLIGARVLWMKDGRGRISLIQRYAQEAPVVGFLERLSVDEEAGTVEAVVLTGGRTVACAPGVVTEFNGRRWPFDPSALMAGAEVAIVLDQGRAIHVSIIQENLAEAVIKSMSIVPPTHPGGAASGVITARMSLGEGDYPLIITAETRITLDGEPADLSELREWDVFSAVTEAGMPIRVIRLAAHRERLTGTVVEVARHFSPDGSRLEVTVEDQQFQRTRLRFTPLCEALITAELSGREFTFCLDRYGDISFLAIPGPTPRNPRVVKALRGHVVRGTMRVTVDWRGDELTYPWPAAAAVPEAGSLVRLHLDEGGQVRFAADVRPAHLDAVVVGTDESAQRLTLSRGSMTWVLGVRSTPIYEFLPGVTPGAAGTAGDFVPLSAVGQGDLIFLDDFGAPTYLLVVPLTGR